MAQTAIVRPARARVDGAVLAIGLALTAELISFVLRDWLAPDRASPVSPVLCAVLLGVAWRNSFGLDASFLPGLQWVTHTLLRAGIALVGLKLALGGFAATTLAALPVVVACIATAIGVSMLMGHLLGLSRPLRLLLAAGTAICGCTAICAVTPVVRARSVESGLAVTCVVVLGCLGMLVYPWLAHAVFGDATRAVGVFLGTSIHDTAQVMGAATIYAQQFNADEAAAVAGLTKLMRNLCLLALVPLFAVWSGAGTEGNPGVKRAQVLPAFLIWFLALALARTVGDGLLADTAAAAAWSQLVAVGLGASELLLVCGMTAVGLSVSLADLRGVGSRALVAALAVAFAVCACSLTLTLALGALA
jgi:uncharacterized integral membrane protein (TIGR00698 family)